MLATLEDLKARLGVPNTDTSQDTDLSAILEVSSDKILSVCRYDEANTTGIVEYLRNVQQGREYRTEKRKIDSVTNPFLVEGRGHGTTFVTLSSDLLDPDEGVWMILGAAAWWPPNYVEERRPRFRRWREPIWPVVRVTYDVTGIGSDASAPAQLREATVALAVYWLGQSKAGAVSQVTIGQLSQTIADKPLPDNVRSMLGKHYDSGSATWVR